MRRFSVAGTPWRSSPLSQQFFPAEFEKLKMSKIALFDLRSQISGFLEKFLNLTDANRRCGPIHSSSGFMRHENARPVFVCPVTSPQNSF